MTVRDSALWNCQAHAPTALAKRLVIVEGDGAWLTSSTGQRLLDGTAGLWHANIGHGREAVARAAYEQMKRLETYHVFGRFANEQALSLADRLAALAPVAGSRVMFTSGGSDAIDLVCKLARRHWQLEGRSEKTVIVSRERAYHGLHAFGTSIGGIPANREGYGAESLVPDTARVDTHDLAAVRARIEEIGPERIAAVIAEPVIGTGGVHGPTPGYLSGLQALCLELDLLLVADEVITGFGRTGALFACERWDLRPDLLVFAKGVTSGYAALGGVLAAPSVADRFFAGPEAPWFRHGLTYAGHATACAVAHANLDILEGEGLVARAAKLESVLSTVLEPLRTHPAVAEVRCGFGFLAGVQLVPEVSAEAVAEATTSEGVILRPLFENTLQISPPFVATDDDLALIADTLSKALDHTLAHAT